METQQCDNCRFYQDRNDGTDTGVCRRHTPVIAPDNRSRFPRTEPTEWCGEYEPATKQAATRVA